MRLGAVEEWTIRNTHEHDDHMFHIHTNPFQVIEVSGQPQADRPWRDTTVVPRPAKGGSVVIPPFSSRGRVEHDQRRHPHERGELD